MNKGHYYHYKVYFHFNVMEPGFRQCCIYIKCLQTLSQEMSYQQTTNPLSQHKFTCKSLQDPINSDFAIDNL